MEPVNKKKKTVRFIELRPPTPSSSESDTSESNETTGSETSSDNESRRIRREKWRKYVLSDTYYAACKTAIEGLKADISCLQDEILEHFAQHPQRSHSTRCHNCWILGNRLSAFSERLQEERDRLDAIHLARSETESLTKKPTNPHSAGTAWPCSSKNHRV